jgi:hypothetical protein
MHTRISAKEFHDIALGVALLYTRNADGCMQTLADYDYPTFQHVELTLDYARDLVWQTAVVKLGEGRADRLSGGQVDRLAKRAMAEFAILLSIGYCHPRGFTRVYGGQ